MSLRGEMVELCCLQAKICENPPFSPPTWPRKFPIVAKFNRICLRCTKKVSWKYYSNPIKKGGAMQFTSPKYAIIQLLTFAGRPEITHRNENYENLIQIRWKIVKICCSQAKNNPTFSFTRSSRNHPNVSKFKRARLRSLKSYPKNVIQIR